MQEEIIPGYDDINMGKYEMAPARAELIAKNFEKFRIRVRRGGLFEGSELFYIRKVFEALAMMVLAVFLQTRDIFVPAALLMGLSWQQLGWLIHEFAHHQLFRSHFHNDLASYFVGNFLQGFSSGGWKEQHNIHHAATNVVGRDGDLDLMPLWATVAADLKLADTWWLNVLPYQHLYWAVGLPFLRLSWLMQSITFVSNMPTSYYECYRKRAVYEQSALALHWVLVGLQLYYLPDFYTRVQFFLVSQLFGGFLLAYVVTYNHYSTDKFPHHSPILENYAALQLYTTRNLRPGPFVDWLFGGLNYQIEHHLFPTMPRHNLSKVMPLVKEWCAENSLPYMVDDYWTGWELEIRQFRNIARLAQKMKRKIAA